MANPILVFCDDLIFTSKITATARAKGLEAAVVRTQDALTAKLQGALWDASCSIYTTPH